MKIRFLHTGPSAPRIKDVLAYTPHKRAPDHGRLPFFFIQVPHVISVRGNISATTVGSNQLEIYLERFDELDSNAPKSRSNLGSLIKTSYIHSDQIHCGALVLDMV